MDEIGEQPGKAMTGALLRALRPAVPAVIGAAALTFLFAAVMPMAWVAAISWNLYLDRLSDLFAPPVGNGGRMALALGMAVVAALVAGLVALVAAKPGGAGWLGRGDDDGFGDGDADEAPLSRRRRADLHPDDPPRPPIRAGRDLPAEGLGSLDRTGSEARAAWSPDDGAAEAAEADDDAPTPAEPEGNPMASEAMASGDEPWLQPAELPTPVSPAPVDRSLGAMVARFEMGLDRRRAARATDLSGDDAGTSEVDFALEAALGTLQRMSREAVG